MKDERLDEIDVVRIDKKNGRVHVFGRRCLKFRDILYETAISYHTGDVFEEKVTSSFFRGTEDYDQKVEQLQELNKKELKEEQDRILINAIEVIDALRSRVKRLEEKTGIISEIEFSDGGGI